ncbi:MAG: sigma-54-dependent Fis family transcriptional regulator [Betaproteobacteria bacterium]|nr:sigma-54-dependent Fis family transcriptional regulator [Betaproteobacteria bacterium]
MEKSRVLIVDDEADIRELLSLTLQRMGLDTDCAASEFEAVQLMQKHGYDLCLTDMRLPDGDGLKLLEHVSKHYTATPVAVITAYGSAENAVAALKAGAFDYLAKPVSLNQLRALVRSALKLPRANQQRKSGDTEAGAGDFPVLLGDSALMQQTRQMIDKLARSQAPIHISGESGCGKELAARLMHLMGPRREAPFMPVNCGAIPENLMESEFFGYKKGAFTGAEQDKEGFFQAANGGTLFLDEVADLPIQMQVKLLRSIQEKKVRKVGSTGEENVDVRIISATHHHLADAVKDGKFRQDLYYRLNVIELRMPALREMRDDIPVLAREILRKNAAEDGARREPALSPAALAALQEYQFPGNVRELENILERAVALRTGDRIETEDLQLTPPAAGAEIATGDLSGLPLQEHLDRVEKEAILQALEKTRYNRTAAAKLLGITFRALRYRMERLGIN